MKIVKASSQLLENLPNIFDLILKYYGEQEVFVYLLLGDKKVDFVVTKDGNSLYIDSNGYRLFKMDKDCNLTYYKDKNYEVYYDNGFYAVDSKGLEYGINVEPLKQENMNVIKGLITYSVYNSEKDIFLSATYQGNYRKNDNGIYLYNFMYNNPESIYLVDNFEKNKYFKWGILPKDIQAFNKLEYSRDMYGFDYVLINENGLLSFLSKGSYNLEKKDNLVRYVKSYIKTKKDYYYDFGFFGHLFKKEEVEDLIIQRGLSLDVDEALLKVYNGVDYYLFLIKDYLKTMREDKDLNEKVMVLKLQNDIDKK